MYILWIQKTGILQHFNICFILTPTPPLLASFLQADLKGALLSIWSYVRLRRPVESSCWTTRHSPDVSFFLFFFHFLARLVTYKLQASRQSPIFGQTPIGLILSLSILFCFVFDTTPAIRCHRSRLIPAALSVILVHCFASFTGHVSF